MNTELANLMRELTKAEGEVINEEQEMYLNHQIPADDFIDLTIATVAGNQVRHHDIKSSFKQEASRKKAKVDEEHSRGSPFVLPVSAEEQTLTTSSASQFAIASVEIDILSSVSPMNEPIIVQVEKGGNDSQKMNII